MKKTNVYFLGVWIYLSLLSFSAVKAQESPVSTIFPQTMTFEEKSIQKRNKAVGGEVLQEVSTRQEALINLQEGLDMSRTSFSSVSGNDTLCHFVLSDRPTVVSDTSLFKRREKAASTATRMEAGESPTQTPRALNVQVSQVSASGSTVGSIPVNSSVSNGTLNYSVPIDIYTTGTVAPSVFLTYNSMGSQGVAGYGWTIGGISAITTANSSYYYDGLYAGAAKLDKTSAYYLDGVRLIKLSESSQEILYETELGNIKVKNHAPSGKFYFTVYYPNGNIARLGHTTDTQAQIDYPVTNMEDRFGNAIQYSYVKSGNRYYVTGISYETSQSVIGSISFSYQNITKTHSIYIAGREVYQDRILTGISTKYSSGVAYRNYTLSYTNDSDNRYFLERLACSAGSSELNPLLFSYGDEYSEGYLGKGYDELLWEYFSGDVVIKKIKLNNLSANNGLIIYPNFETYGITGQSNYGYCTYGSKFSSDQNLLVYEDVSGWYSPRKIKAGEGFQLLTAVDYNGDGNDELVKINYVEENKKGKVTITTYNKSFTPSSHTIYLEGYVQEGDWRSPAPRYWSFGDFDGDGKLELFTVNSSYGPRTGASSTSKIDVIDLNTKQVLSSSYLGYDIDYFGEQIFFTDLNGDSKSELAMITYYGTALYEHVVSPDYLYRLYAEESSLTPQTMQNRNFFIEDLNGDGKMDFLLSPSQGSSSWTVYTSTGVNFVKTSYSPFTRSSNESYIFQDVNGDGRPDLIRKSGSSLSSYLNKEGKLSLTPASGSVSVESAGKLIGATVTGLSYTNRLSQVLVVKDAYATPVVYSRNDAMQRMLSQMTNSMGVTTYHSYSDITAGYNYYVSSSDLAFPYNKVFAPINVVSDISAYSGGQLVDYRSFQYQDAVIHKQLGFRGFSKITTYNGLSGDVVTQQYNPEEFGMPKSVETPTLSESFTYSVSVASNKITRILLTNKATTDKLKEQTVHSSFTYDAYGNLLTETADFGGGNKQITTNSYATYTALSNYFLGEVNSRTIRKEKGAEAAVNREVFSYNLKHQPLLHRQYTGSLQTGEQTYQYNSQGNPTEINSKAYDTPHLLTTTRVYDPLGRITKETDPLGLTVEYFYNGKGELTSTKNHKGQETFFEYDAFGQLVKTSYPDGTVKQTRADWYAQIAATEFPTHQPEDLVLSAPVAAGGEVKACRSVTLQPGFSFTASAGNSLRLTTDANVCASPPQGASSGYMITEEATGMPAVKTYYDAIGREVRKSQLRFDGVYMNVDTQYDYKGRVSKVSDPFKNGSAPQWNVYTYDNFHRVKELTSASGKKDVYSYDKNKVTSVIDGVSTTKEFDALGQLARVTDPSGSIVYNYRPDGQPTSITVPGGITTTFEYDNYGRQTKIIDPSAGTKTYAYDQAGNLWQETDANGKVTTTTYDKYHRLTNRQSPEMTTAYVYDEYGRPVSETSNNGTSLQMVYDAFDRLVQKKETVVDGEWLEKNYQYAGNALSSASYSTVQGWIATERYSYAYGHHVETHLDGTGSVWKLKSEDSRGHVSRIITGSLTRTYQYDAYGFPVARRVDGSYGTVLSHSYEFNQTTGNLNYRRDNLRDKTETFQYDGLNRLTGVNGSAMYAYDPTGNITSSSGVGVFEYNLPNKPYAVTNVLPSSQSSIPLRNQSVNYTSFMRPSDITENGLTARFAYNASGDRVKMTMEQSGSVSSSRYYIGGQYEKEVTGENAKERLYLGGDAYSASLVYQNEGNGWKVYYICRDYLGNIVQVTNSSGMSLQELSFDAWGRLRDPDTHAVYATGQEPALFLNRGYTGHEHLTAFGLINMNARLYDPLLGRFLSPDPYVQAPEWAQNFNRYSYGLNNPMRYVDEDGEWILIPIAIYCVFFTDIGYDIQKTLSPVAIKFDLRIGNHQGGIGIDVSIGLPQALPISYRIHGGATYFWKNEDLMGNNMSGWETRYGAEWGVSFGPVKLTYGGTTFNSKWSGEQTTNLITFGDPFFNIKYENDMVPEGIFKYIPFVPKGDGDRYRTAAVQINFGPFGVGTKMMTGDAGPYRTKNTASIDGHETYLANNGYDPNNYRMGLFYFKFGPFRFGKNSENTRKILQNQFAHDFLTGGKSKWFEVLSLQSRWYWGFGYSGGGTLW